MSSLFAYWLPGWQELLILAFIVMLLFPARLGSMMFNLGDGLKSFRKGLKDHSADGADTDEPAA